MPQQESVLCSPINLKVLGFHLLSKMSELARNKKDTLNDIGAAFGLTSTAYMMSRISKRAL